MMKEATEIPGKVKAAVRKFHKARANYYQFAASLLRSSGGTIKILQLFENDAQRYAGKARGVLCEYWADKFANNGGNVADTFEGTLPADEVAILRVAQNAGADALLSAFDDVARMAKLSDLVKKESMGTLISGLVGFALAIIMLTIFPLIAVGALKDNYDFLPLEYWGKNGKNLLNYAAWIKANSVYMVLLVGLLFSYVKWSIPNLTSPIREWLDRHNVLYRTICDLKGSLFLATMSTLTKNRAGVMFTLEQSLRLFAESAQSPWLKWRINQIIDGADATGAIGVDAFNTGLINEEMFYYLEDMNQANGFSEGFEKTGEFVESVILERIIKQMVIYRWALLLIGLAITLVMFVWQFQVIYEMRGAMSNYLASS